MAAQAVAVELFSTSILSNHKVRNRHERYVSILQVKKIPFVYHDLASDEDAKARWKRKALDPQIPGLLVHNEWRGTFEEFEESIEFGELDLFLKIDQERLIREADQGLAPQLAATTRVQSQQNDESQNGNLQPTPTPTPRKPSKHVVAEVPRLAQPRGPSMNALAPALPTAKAGYDKVEKAGAEGFLRSLGIEDLNMTEEELNEVLEAGRSTTEERKARASGGGVESADRGEGKYPINLGLGTSSANQNAVPRTYIPSAEAGVAPLRLAKMGNGSTSRSSSDVPVPHARYNASQISSRALAAEAQATASSRSFSTTKLRAAVSQGDDLKSAMSQTRLVSGTDTAEQVVGREDIDDLLASLGLDDVKMTDEEAEAFLFDGSIPDTLGANNERVRRSNSLADRARNEVAAHDVAQRARERGYGSPSLSSDGKSIKSPSASVENLTKDVQSPKEANIEDKEEDIKPSEEGIPEKKSDADEKAESEEDKQNKTPDASLIIAGADSNEEKTDELESERIETSQSNVISNSQQDKAEEFSKSGDLTKVAVAEKAAEVAVSKESVKSVTPEEVKDETKSVASEDLTKDEASEPFEKQAASEEEKESESRTAESTPRQKTVDLFPSPPPLPVKSNDEKISTENEDHTENEKSSEATPPASPPISPRKSSTQISPSTPSKGRTTKPAPLELNTSPLMEKSSLITTPEGKENVIITPTSSPTSARQTINIDRLTSPPISAGHSSVRSDQSRSPPSSAGIPGSRTYNRRKGIDVPRRNVSESPSSERIFSPSLSATMNGSNMIQRSPGGVGSGLMSPSLSGGSLKSGGGSFGRNTSLTGAEMMSFSPDSSGGMKSPKSPKSAKKLFSIGRKNKDKQRGRKSGSSIGGDESDEDIPSTIDPNLIESRSMGRIDSIGSAHSSMNGRSNTSDRSQKTLSVILREADEALSGLDGDDDGEGGLGLDNLNHDEDDDFDGAFDLDIDLDGDDGMEIEQGR